MDNVDLRSEVNLGVIKELVNREVFYPAGTETEFILGLDSTMVEPPYTWDDVTNLYPDNSEEIQELVDEADRLEGMRDELEADMVDVDEEIADLEDKIAELTREQESPQDIMEWYRVSNMMAQRLVEWGEPVIEAFNLWGRTTAGQYVYMDCVFGYIARDMKILQEQDYSWVTEDGR